MFIKYKDNKIVNLNNVSNIYIDRQAHDGRGNAGKVIFNMNYSVKIFDGKYTPDYVYWMFNNERELQDIIDMFEARIEYARWIMPVEDDQRYINVNCVSSIALDDSKNRVIFNLNYNVTHPKDMNKLTSDFVFYTFSDRNTFKNFKNKWL